jgi:5-aminopentanamidase
VTVVAAAQIAPVVGDVAANRRRTREAVEQAAARGADLVVLPELAQSGYVFADAAEARSLAESLDGPTVREWSELSRRLRLVLVAGFCEQGPDGRVFNSAVLLERGQLLASYRKAHLWDRETLVFTPGDQHPPVVETLLGRVATMICYDVEFPEWTRMAGLAGADVLAVPTNWPLEPRPEGERPMEVVRLQAAASANRMFVVAADRCGEERSIRWVGGSVILGPHGYPLAGPVAADREEVLWAKVDLGEARTKTISSHNHVFADRRPDLYARVASRDG